MNTINTAVGCLVSDVLFFFLELVIGFKHENYTVQEGHKLLEVSVAVLSGKPGTEVVLKLCTKSGAAIGNKNYFSLALCLKRAPSHTKIRPTYAITMYIILFYFREYGLSGTVNKNYLF